MHVHIAFPTGKSSKVLLKAASKPHPLTTFAPRCLEGEPFTFQFPKYRTHCVGAVVAHPFEGGSISNSRLPLDMISHYWSFLMSKVRTSESRKHFKHDPCARQWVKRGKLCKEEAVKSELYQQCLLTASSGDEHSSSLFLCILSDSALSALATNSASFRHRLGLLHI